MLTLTRSIGQQIKIIVPPSDKPQEIIIEHRGKSHRRSDAVKIGIKADRTIEVIRTELLEVPDGTAARPEAGGAADV